MKTKLNIDKRWEDGDDHHPKAEELAKLVAKIDQRYNGDSLMLEFGEDGDSGEQLLYALDVIFDAIDNGELEELKKKVGVK